MPSSNTRREIWTQYLFVTWYQSLVLSLLSLWALCKRRVPVLSLCPLFSLNPSNRLSCTPYFSFTAYSRLTHPPIGPPLKSGSRLQLRMRLRADQRFLDRCSRAGAWNVWSPLRPFCAITFVPIRSPACLLFSAVFAGCGVFATSILGWPFFF
jgi:hypothetical protein